MYKDATLILDAMSIKSVIQFDPSKKQNFGFVDHGGLATSGDFDQMATDALVCMKVGLMGHWKMPVGYFMTRSITAEVQAGMVREALIRSYEAVVCVCVCVF